MSAEATGWVWRNSPHSGATLLVHLAIADVVNDANQWECWLTIEAIAAKARVGRSSTVTALSTLTDLGFLSVTVRGGGRGKPTRYTFLMPKETCRISAGSPRPKRASKRADLNGETCQSDARIGITEVTEITGDEPSSPRRVSDPACVRCHGDGVLLSSSPGPDGEPFKLPCPCTDSDYVPAPSKATRPVVGFGMPANRERKEA